MARYDTVLFDADNTLFDFDKAEARALALTLSHYGFPETESVRARYLAINRGLWAAFDRGEIPREALVVERFAALQREVGGSHDPGELNAYYISRLGEGADLLPGAASLVRALAPRCTLAIVTNGVARAQRGRFARSPLKDLIPWLFISEELGAQKPERAFFDAVLRAMDISDPSRTVVVGDSLSADIQGAINADLDSVWYNPNHLPGRPETPATWEVADFDQLLSLLLA